MLPIQIQHLLKLNLNIVQLLLLANIQIQHLLKLNENRKTQATLQTFIQIQHLLKLNFEAGKLVLSY